MARGSGKRAISEKALNLSIVFAPSGVGLNRSIKKFHKWLGKHHESAFLSHSDVEEKLLHLAREKGLITSPRARIKEVIKNYPRELVRDLWNSAFQISVNEIGRQLKEANNPEAAIPIITGHCVYYHPTQPQFYVPLHCGHIQNAISSSGVNLKIGRVILLIDDILDMYRRLCGKNEILDRFHACGTALRSYWNQRGAKANPSILQKKGVALLGSNDQERIVSLNTIMEQIIKLLNWRLQEKTVAEHLARELNSQFVLFAIKQSFDVFLHTLRGKKTVYVSHPITTPRRDSDLNTNQLVQAVNRIPSLLDNFACISPTAIDELRFHYIMEQPYEGSLKLRNGGLTERWPLIAAKGNILWDAPTDDLPANEVLLKLEAKYLHDRIAIDSAYTPLQNSIMLQIAHRDHILVANCDALIVIRNYYSGLTSRGVAEEILHWGRRVQYEKKSTVFILFPEDVIAMTRFMHKDSFRNALRDSMIQYLCQATDISEVRLRRMSLERRETPLGALDPEEGNSMKEALQRDNLVHRLLKLILPGLCAVQIEPSGSALVLCVDNKDLFGRGAEIQAFLDETCDEGQVLSVLTDFWSESDVNRIEQVLATRPLDWDVPEIDTIKSIGEMMNQEIRLWLSKVS